MPKGRVVPRWDPRQLLPRRTTPALGKPPRTPRQGRRLGPRSGNLNLLLFPNTCSSVWPLRLRVPRDQGRRAASRVRSAGPVMRELLLLRAFPLLCAVSNCCVPSVLGCAARPLSLFTLAASSDAEKRQRARRAWTLSSKENGAGLESDVSAGEARAKARAGASRCLHVQILPAKWIYGVGRNREPRG